MKKTIRLTSGFLIAVFTFFCACSKSNGGDNPSSPLPGISMADNRVPEGNTAGNFNFTVRLSKASTATVSVTCTTVEGTAKAGTDFTATTQTISFAPNETEKTFSVPIIADDIREADESFKVVFSSPVNGLVSNNETVGTIENDDTRIPYSNTGYDAPASYPGYTLAWSDEFNNTSLNTTDWSFENGDGCPNVCGWGNNELETYRPENLFFQDGKMVIEAKKETFAGKDYTSSKILTRGKKTFKYGRIDFRAILPKGKGIWPAFWMLPQNNVFGGWPRSGEIDIMEMVGHLPAQTVGTLHFGPGPGSIQLGGNYTLPSGTLNDQFHVYSIEWKNNEIRWLLDNVVFSTHTIAEFGANNYPFNEDFFFIINLAVGGNWPGSPDAATVFPQWLIVDYVRVYQ